MFFAPSLKKSYHGNKNIPSNVKAIAQMLTKTSTNFFRRQKKD